MTLKKISRLTLLLLFMFFVACATTTGTSGGNDDEDVCGDGVVGTAEECDDGNTTADDGCSATCEDEEGFTTVTGTSLGSGFTALDANPCDAVGGLAYSIFAESANNIWLGCAGAGGGLFKSTDGGTTFIQVTEANSGVTSIDGDNAYFGEGGDASPDVRFYDIEADDDGNILLCGGNNEDEVQDETSKVFLYRYNTAEDEYEVLLTKDILIAAYGQQMSDCDNVAVTGDNIVADDLAGTKVAYSSDAGVTWDVFDDSESIWDMLVVDNTIYASGGTTGAGAEFFEFDATYDALTAYDVDNATDTIQDGRALATPDDGETWLVGTAYDTGTDVDGDGTDDNVIVRYSTDNGTTWNDADLGDTSGYSFIRAMACSGDDCVAAGDAYPASEGGYIIQSTDGGMTWSEISLSSNIATIYSVSIYGSTAFFAGDGGNIYSLGVCRRNRFVIQGASGNFLKTSSA